MLLGGEGTEGLHVVVCARSGDIDPGCEWIRYTWAEDCRDKQVCWQLKNLTALYIRREEGNTPPYSIAGEKFLDRQKRNLLLELWLAEPNTSKQGGFP